MPGWPRSLENRSSADYADDVRITHTHTWKACVTVEAWAARCATTNPS